MTGIAARDVSAVLVTRGNVDLTPILDTFTAAGLHDFVVWDNSRRATDFRVFGRYAGMAECERPVVYVQDDDVLVDVPAVLARYEPGRICAAMPQSRWADYPDSCLVGWGAVMDRTVTELAIVAYLDAWPMSDRFLTECDVAVTALSPRTVFDLGMPNHLPWAEGNDRMFRQPDHKRRRDETLQRARELRRWHDDDRRI